MIPKRFLILFDLAILLFAFPATYLGLPRLQPVISWIDTHWPRWSASLRIQEQWTGIAQPPGDWLWAMFVVSLVTFLLNDVVWARVSLLKQSRVKICAGSFAGPLLGLSLVALIQFGLKTQAVSRLFLFVAVMLSGAGLVICRLLIRAYTKRRVDTGFYAKNTVLIGEIAALEWIKRHFSSELPPSEYRLVGYLKLGLSDSDQSIAGLPCLGNVTELGDMLIHKPLHEVIAIEPAKGAPWLAKVVQHCDYLRIPLWIIPEVLLDGELRDLHFAVQSNPLHLPAIVMRPREFNSEALFIKRLLDVLVSGVLMLLLLPLLAVIAFAIKLRSPRSKIFYHWRVVGQNGVEFTGYKFTTMIEDADEQKPKLAARNEMTGPVFKIKNDPRVTPLGRFLRKFSLNELPQLWSVFKGDMSLVGPRPAFRHELDRYEFWHKRKLSIKPGITCLWQIRGRNKISNFDEWVKMDLEYINHWSLWLDLRILLKTTWIVIAGTGS